MATETQRFLKALRSKLSISMSALEQRLSQILIHHFHQNESNTQGFKKMWRINLKYTNYM